MSAPEEDIDGHKRGDSEVSRHYRELNVDEVPSALDDAILAQAREEIRSTHRFRRWRRWTAPFALAASAVLALSILFRSGTDRETLIMQQAPQVASAPPALSVQVPTTSKPNEPPAPNAEGELSGKAERDASAVAKVARQPAFAPGAASSRTAEPTGVLEKRTREKLEDVPAPVNEQPTSQLAQIQEERVSTRAQLANQTGATRDAVAQSTMPSAPAAFELKKAADEMDSAQAAERWLLDIRKLRAKGRIAAADKQWHEFRKTFPDYVVSADDPARPKP